MNFQTARPTRKALGDQDVHVWLVRLDRSQGELEQLQRILSPDEVNRAGRFRFAHDRQGFVVARGALRQLLGIYLNEHPAQLRFQYSDFGKPCLAGDDQLRFNISHAGSYALMAFAWRRRVGLDIECEKLDVDVEAVAQHFFSPYEIQTLMSLPIEQRHKAFFACWTRKEAYIKAIGEGLSMPLDQFDVSLTPGEAAALLATRPDANEAARWSLTSVDAPLGYSAALVAEGHDWQATVFCYDDLQI